MKKLKLMLDELAVETFETVKPMERRGTVVGQGDSSAGPVDCAYGCQNPTDDFETNDCIPSIDCTFDRCFTNPCFTTETEFTDCSSPE